MREHSLLDEGVFHATAADGLVARLSLPQVLARLSAGDDLTFTALRPHQRAPWHAFLVQLAYLALEAEDDPQPPLTPEAWAERLRALTPSYTDDGPWCLINSDWQQPAFLQAPCSSVREADFNLEPAFGAQKVDVLVTARNHDEKSGKLTFQDGEIDALIYSLVTLQGMTPGLGRGNYNSMRMNGFYSSRPQFRLAFCRGSGHEFLRDLTVLLDARGVMGKQFEKLHPAADTSALHRLLWLSTWDEGSLPLSTVHPLCLEVCRRVRLAREDGQLLLRRASSDAMRVAAKDQRGVVMDPWVPIVKDPKDGAPKALTAQAHSLGYRSLQAMLFDNDRFIMPLLAEPSLNERRANQPGTWIAQVLVSGDGGTDGLLARELPAPPRVLMQRASGPAALAHRSQLFVNLAGLASGKVLRSVLLQFVDGGDDVDWKNRDFTRAVEPWVDRFEQAIDDAFFTQLFDTIEHLPDDDMQAQRQWVGWLADAARAHLTLAAQALPTRDGSRLFAQARAERLFRLSLHKQFGALLPPRPEASAPTEAEPEDSAHG